MSFELAPPLRVELEPTIRRLTYLKRLEYCLVRT